MLFNKEDLDFVNNINNAKELALNNNKVTLLKFIDLHKQEIIKYIIGSNTDVRCYFYGGFEDSEYKRCLISQFDISEEQLKVVIFKINYNKKYLSLTHRNILGNLMSLGITRDSIGDIYVNDECYFAATKEISSYLIQEVKTLNNQPVTLEEIKFINIAKKEEYNKKIYIISSLRIDVIISFVYNISRSISKDLVMHNKVKVNHNICTNANLIIKEGDLISVQQKGRMKVFKVLNETLKKKIRVEIGTIK